MGKIIKRKVKKSFPWLVALCLLSSFVVGFSFNLNFDFLANNNGLIDVQDVQAGTASTTVQVADTPPFFSVGGEPEEFPVPSASTTPINVGGSISFKATADDPEDIGWSLIVCSSSSVAVVDWATSCTGGGF